MNNLSHAVKLCLNSINKMSSETYSIKASLHNIGYYYICVGDTEYLIKLEDVLMFLVGIHFHLERNQ